MSDDNGWGTGARDAEASQAPGMLSFFLFLTLLNVTTRQLKFFLYLILDSNTHNHHHHERPPPTVGRRRGRVRRATTMGGARDTSVSRVPSMFFSLSFFNSINDYLRVGYVYNNINAPPPVYTHQRPFGPTAARLQR